jgi:hypothetical protein
MAQVLLSTSCRDLGDRLAVERERLMQFCVPIGEEGIRRPGHVVGGRARLPLWVRAVKPFL